MVLNVIGKWVGVRKAPAREKKGGPPPRAGKGKRVWDPYLALQGADEHVIENLAGLVAVADILERLGSVLAADIEEDFLTAAVASESAISPP